MTEADLRQETGASPPVPPEKPARRRWPITVRVLLGLFVMGSLALNALLLGHLLGRTPDLPWLGPPGPPRSLPEQPAPTPAPDPSATDAITVNPGEIRTEIDAPGQPVRIAGQVMGRVRAGDVTVYSGGVVGGDIASTGRVHVEGTVTGAVAGAVAEVGARPQEAFPTGYVPQLEPGQRGTVHGAVQATTVAVGPGGRIAGPVRAQGPVEVWGRIDGDVSAERVLLRGRAWVGGNVEVSGGAVEVAPGATIAGLVRSGAGGIRLEMAPAEPQDQSAGQTSPRAPEPPAVVRSEGPWGKITAAVGALIGTLSLVGLTYAFWPGPAEWVAGHVRTAPLRSLVAGLWTVVAIPALAGAAAITLLGIPVALLVLTAGVAAGLLGLAAAGRVVGDRLRQTLRGPEPSPLAEVLAGTLALLLLLLVPLLGWAAFGVLVLMGTGAATTYGYPRLRDAWAAWRQRRREARSSMS